MVSYGSRREFSPCVGLCGVSAVLLYMGHYLVAKGQVGVFLLAPPLGGLVRHLQS